MSVDESVVLARDGSRLADFRFEDRLRVDAATAVAELKGGGLRVEIVSGDRETAVRPIAAEFGVRYLAAAKQTGTQNRIGFPGLERM
jgi:Cu2+-exporting ATPase